MYYTVGPTSQPKYSKGNEEKFLLLPDRRCNMAASNKSLASNEYNSVTVGWTVQSIHSTIGPNICLLLVAYLHYVR